jgi:hypothetical protein
MSRLVVLLLFAALSLRLAAPALALGGAAPGHGAPRVAVVVHRNWPLTRPQRLVIVHTPRTSAAVVVASFPSPVVFGGRAVAATAAPTRDVIAWEDGETLSKGEDWTEFTLGCGARGTRLWLELPEGRVQVDWAEIVFDDGQAQVVDFAEKTLGDGLYPLLEFKDGRTVDHVRVVARAKKGEAMVVLRMQKG